MTNYFYINCDKLNKIPKANKENWLAEIKLLKNEITQNAKVLQVGCMDGTRIISLLKARSDLNITGLDIEKEFLAIARENLKKQHLKAQLVEGDITKRLPLSGFDYVICLNNTLGYIRDDKTATENMKRLGKKVVISVYGEKFTDDLGLAYFKSIGLKINRIEDNIFQTDDSDNIKRYTRNEVNSWGGEVTETPIGYYCVIDAAAGSASS